MWSLQICFLWISRKNIANPFNVSLLWCCTLVNIKSNCEFHVLIFRATDGCFTEGPSIQSDVHEEITPFEAKQRSSFNSVLSAISIYYHCSVHRQNCEADLWRAFEVIKFERSQCRQQEHEIYVCKVLLQKQCYFSGKNVRISQVVERLHVNQEVCLHFLFQAVIKFEELVDKL